MNELRKTLGNREWLTANETAIKSLLPVTWTLATNLDGPRLGFGLKLLGVDWSSADEFGLVMVFLEKVGLLQRRDYQVRANPSRVFPTVSSG